MNQTLSLAKGQAIELPDARGAVVRVLRGRVWLTQDRDRRDIVLEAGEAWALDHGGLTVAQAQANSTVGITHCGSLRSRVTKAARSKWPARLSAWITRKVAIGGSSRVPYY